MKSYFIELPQHVKNMDSQELRYYFNEDIEKSVLMRSIIINERQYGATYYERSLRSLWYSTVKPTLDKLGLLTEDDQTEEGLTKWDAVLSRYVADLLRRGYLTYKDLNIEDNSRQRANPSNYYNVDEIDVYGNQVTISPYSNIIIATEKDTVYNIIRNLAKLFGCSCISSKGQNSLGAMESLIRGMKGDFNDIFILTMTDYDPAGFYIAEALKKQVNDILYALGKTHINSHVMRIGITPNQLSPQLVEANKYTPKQANLDKWFKLTGGINGEPKGLELDALTPDEIRKIFVENIQEYIDTDIYSEFIIQSYIRKAALDAMASEVDKIINKVISKFEKKVQLKKFKITDIAVEGYSSLPIQSLCEDNQDRLIKDYVKKYFIDNIKKGGA